MSAADELRKIAGKKNVRDDADTLARYAKDESFARPIRPKCVVNATDAQTVQSVIQWANNTRTPLVPVSSGAPHFRGDTVPCVGGAVILDMSGMKKIIRVSYREQLALVEPGVTFAELTPALEKENLLPHTPLVPRQSKSVIGSYLEKEPILQPRHHWCPIDPLLTCQLVLGSGDLLQTGSSKGLWSLEEEWKQKKAQKWWASESYDIVKISQGSQGTVSVLTWAAIKCALLPAIHKIYLVPCDRLEPLIELAYTLLRYRWGEELFILNNQTLASILAEKGEDIPELRDVFPPFLLVVGIAGFPEFFPEERVDTQEKDITEHAAHLGLNLKPAIEGVRGEDVKRALYRPTEGEYWKMRYKGAFQDIFFVTTLDRTSAFIDEMAAQATRHGYPATDVGVYLQPIVQGTSCHCEFHLPYRADSAREADKVRDLVDKGAQALGDKNAYFYRPYGSWKEIAYRRVSGEEYTALKKVKEIFDPNKILNPGKVCF
jgi:FAD/FMN-containing dehydrogenase